MRSFIAVRIPATQPMLTMLRTLSLMQPVLKMVVAEQFHVTLNFLGETDEARVADLAVVLNEVAAAAKVHDLTLRGVGAFPRIDEPKVVWIGLRDSGPLVSLADTLATRCEGLGFVREVRPFQPHLTLARVGSSIPHSLGEFIRDRIDVDFGTVTISTVELFRSDLGPAGPVYKQLVSAPLGSASSREP